FRIIVPDVITAVSTSCNHTIIITIEGRIYTCGLNTSGQLGTNDLDTRHRLTLISIPTVVTVVSAGGFHTAVITSEGRLYTCGADFAGQLGKDNNQWNGRSQLTSIDH